MQGGVRPIQVFLPLATQKATSTSGTSIKTLKYQSSESPSLKEIVRSIASDGRLMVAELLSEIVKVMSRF